MQSNQKQQVIPVTFALQEVRCRMCNQRQIVQTVDQAVGFTNQHKFHFEGLTYLGVIVAPEVLVGSLVEMEHRQWAAQT